MHISNTTHTLVGPHFDLLSEKDDPVRILKRYSKIDQTDVGVLELRDKK